MIKGEYMTKNRKLIFTYLQDHKDALVSAKDIHIYYNEKGPKINISTIYRNLYKLEKEGIIRKYMSENGKTALYQFETHESENNEHLHLQCIKCGKVVHLDCQFMNEIYSHISNYHGFEIQCKNSIIYGICKDCTKTI